MEKLILVVDDEKPILQVLAILFKNEGYTPRCTSSAAAALEIVAHEEIKLCFLDLRMPDMDGMQLCRQIKQIRSEIHIFALSAYVDAFSQEELQQNGFTRSFCKPFEIDELREACAQALGDPATPASGGTTE